MEPAPRHDFAGLAYGIAAYTTWGMAPMFWKLLHHVSPVELLAHRVVWGFLAFGGLLWARARVGELGRALRDRRTCVAILASALLLSANWLTFIYAIVTDRVLYASLGYFVNPLLSVVLGMTFLGERLRRAQKVAIVLAIVGVGQFAAQADELPWISLVLAGTFAVYGLVRKTVRVDALPGSTMETLLLVPVAAGYLLYLGGQGQGQLGHGDGVTSALLLATGLVTALPLLWFTNAARRLPLWALGFLQYLAPSLQFVLAVAVYGEPFGAAELRSFLCIWAGLAVIAWSAAWTRRRPGAAFSRSRRGERGWR